LFYLAKIPSPDGSENPLFFLIMRHEAIKKNKDWNEQQDKAPKKYYIL
jgi:hypothetical protein